LLLEHGREYYEWVNRLLDRGAVGHAVRYGCWYNKDVGEVVRESGLVVGSVRRYHLGTMWEIVLRPNPALLKGEERVKLGLDQQEKQDGVDGGVGASAGGHEKRKSWWPW
jgi:methyltransferase OMS1